MLNALGRNLPDSIPGYGEVRPYNGAFADMGEHRTVSAVRHSTKPSARTKIVANLEEAIRRSGLRDGMTVSFHHHLRNGDGVVNMVMNTISGMGIRDLTLAASGIFACHAPLVPLMETGVITGMTFSATNRGPVAKAISEGVLEKPAVLMSHGGRARAIADGKLHIDVAFIAAPSSDCCGNCNGTDGPSACGYLSYAYPDAEYADCVVVVTDNLTEYPNFPIEISQDKVDMVVVVDSIGSPDGIESGTTKLTTDPDRLRIADYAARLTDACGLIQQGMSFQTGAGGISLAVAVRVADIMRERGIVGSFGVGGIHKAFVEMLEEGLFRALFDVQCFDKTAAASAGKDPRHIAISANQYADPHARGCVLHNLDTVVLGASEIDTDFNVNVISGTDGVILGASGGHQDAAAGARLTIIVSPLTRKNFCIVRESVTTIATPGETIDAFVTEYGIAINPRRQDLIELLKDSDLPLVSMAELKEKGEALVGPQSRCTFGERVVAVSEYRDGSVIDVLYKPAGAE